MLIKYIHPKTGTVRDVEENHANKIRILKRGGFIPLSDYKPKKKRVPKPEKTASDVVQDNMQAIEDQAEVNDPEVAIHVSSAARALIEKNDLDPGAIAGTGKDEQITKTDVKKHLKLIEVLETEKKKKMEEDQAKLIDQLNAELPENPFPNDESGEVDKDIAGEPETADDAAGNGPAEAEEEAE